MKFSVDATSVCTIGVVSIVASHTFLFDTKTKFIVFGCVAVLSLLAVKLAVWLQAGNNEEDTPLNRALSAVDAAHSKDPKIVDGRAAEIVYADGIEKWVKKLAGVELGDVLLLAARCQHLERWTIPRSDPSYAQPPPKTLPEGPERDEAKAKSRLGYLKWRKDVKNLQGDRAKELLVGAGVAPGIASRVRGLVSKRLPLSDPNMQILEDAACLVFLEEQITTFTEGKEEVDLVKIIQKTWGKMSDKAHEEALTLTYDPKVLELIQRALRCSCGPGIRLCVCGSENDDRKDETQTGGGEKDGGGANEGAPVSDDSTAPSSPSSD